MAIGIDRRLGGRLGDRLALGHPVDGGGAGEDHMADAAVPRRVHQAEGAGDVVVVVEVRLLDGLAD